MISCSFEKYRPATLFWISFNGGRYLHAERNTHIITEEDGQESSIFFAALHRKLPLKDKVGKKQLDEFPEMPLAKSLPTKYSTFYEIQYFPSILCRCWAHVFSGQRCVETQTCRLSDELFEMPVFLKIKNFNIKDFVWNGLQLFLFASDNIICCVQYKTQESVTYYLFMVLIKPTWGVISNSNI